MSKEDKNARKAKLLQELQDLENENIETLEKPTSEPISEPAPEIDTVEAVKTKRPRTEKQREAFEKALAIKEANALARKMEREKKEEEERKIIEEKLVKKAIALKKKQIKKQAVLDAISDDDTPLEQCKKPIVASEVASKKTEVVIPQLPPQPPAPIIRFY